MSLMSAVEGRVEENVFRSCWNARYDDDVLIADGSAFHALAADTGNALSPSVIRRVDGTRNVDVEP